MRTFEETKKFAYTHGLEKIYSLETVDIKTVRPVKSAEKKQPKKPLFLNPIPKQLDIDCWNKDHPLFAPVKQLRLPSSFIQLLEERELFLIADAIEKLHTFAETERLQLKTAIDRYMEAIPFIAGYGIQLRTWLNISSDSLTAIDNIEKEKYFAGLKKACHIFFSPWIKSRGGFVKRYELTNYMRNLTQEKDLDQILEKLHRQFGLWEHVLITLEDDLFCVDREAEKKFHAVMKIVKTYFYAPKLKYPLKTLIDYLVRETLLSPQEIEKIVRLSSNFIISCGPNQYLEIYEKH